MADVELVKPIPTFNPAEPLPLAIPPGGPPAVPAAGTVGYSRLHPLAPTLQLGSSLRYGRLAKGFGTVTGILAATGLACFGTGIGYYSTSALGTTLYVLSPLPWLGQGIPEPFIEAGRTGDRWMTAGAILTGAAVTTTLLTIAFGIKSRSNHSR